MAVGKRTRRIDWREVTTGAIHYTGDLSFPDALVARFVRSPHPHASIRSIDTSQAEQLPGVEAIVTAADFGDAFYIHQDGPLADRRPLAKEKVRYVGEEIAAVAAETHAQAEAAVRAVRVTYGTQPAVTSVNEALAGGAPLLHEGSAGNVAHRLRRTFGRRPEGTTSAVSVSGRYYFARQTHLCMETHRTTALWHSEEQILELWTSTQSPYLIRKEVAHVLGLELDQVKTRQVAVGGGFGAKSKIAEHEVLVAALAMKCPARAVSVIYDREEEFVATKPRHDFHVWLQTEAAPDGQLLGHQARIAVDNGAYNHFGPSVMVAGCNTLVSLYRSDFADVDAQLIYTNKQPGGQFRGYGAPQATFAVECQMDELAQRLSMDPIDLRLRNVHDPGQVTHAGWRIVDTHVSECLRKLRQESGWEEKRACGGHGRGIGMAAAIHASGKNTYVGSERSEASVTVHSDGRVVVGFGGADAGTGQRTLIAAVAAEELGLATDAVEVVMMDSDWTPTDFGAWSSRGTFMSGHATRAAARAAADGLKTLAGEKFGVAPVDVTLEAGRAQADGDSVDIGSLVSFSEDGLSGQLCFDGEYVADTERADIEGAPRNVSPTYAFAAQAVEVEVDRETGKVRVLDVTAVHDSGKPLSPIDFEGQIVGGVAMGLGAALGEEVVYEGGRVVNTAYLNYAAPRAADLPPIRVIPVSHQDPVGPYGAKGIGEISLNPTAAALANAVAHAIGVRIRDLPITPDKVLAALREEEKTPPRRYLWHRRPGRVWVAVLRWLYPRGLHALLHRYGTRFARRRASREIECIEQPEDLEQAAELLTEYREAHPVGGGTDLFPAREQGLISPAVLINTGTIRSMLDIVETVEGDLLIGGAVPLATLAEHPAIDPVIRGSVESIASAQIREMATVGGNLCQEKRCWFYRNDFTCYKRGGATCPCYAVMGDHRFHHAVLGAHRCQAVTPSDLATVFSALDAVVSIHGPNGQRDLPMHRFYRGPGETFLTSEELVTEVRVPAASRQRINQFEKLNLWHGDFAVVSAATSLTLEGDVVRDARLVLGGVAPTPYRAHTSEQALVDAPLGVAVINRASESWAAEAHPLSGNEWKVDAAVGVLRKCLRASAERSAGEDQQWPND